MNPNCVFFVAKMNCTDMEQKTSEYELTRKGWWPNNVVVVQKWFKSNSSFFFFPVSCRRQSVLFENWNRRSPPWRRRESSCRPSARSRSSRGPSWSWRPRTCRMSWQATVNRGYGSLPSASFCTRYAAPTLPLPLYLCMWYVYFDPTPSPVHT